MLSKLVDKSYQVQLRSRLSTQPLGVFRGFLRNSFKYGLGSLRKIPTEGTSLQVQVPQADNWPQNLQPNPLVTERYCAQNCQTGGARFKPLLCLSTWSFGIFRGFVRNSRKYGQGSLRKASHGGLSRYRPRPHKWTIGLNPCN